jgi:ribose transport system substrate-binding protein
MSTANNNFRENVPMSITSETELQSVDSVAGSVVIAIDQVHKHEGRLSGSDPYLLETVSRACDVIKCFGDDDNLKLRDIIQKTGLNKTIAFRIVHTLVERGLLERCTNLSYRSTFTPTARPRYRIGYAAQADDSSFSTAVTAGIRLAAARQNIELIFLDNCYSAAVALKNAQKLAASHVDLVLDFQTHMKIAPTVSAIFREAGIPLIAIEIPHPDAIFYGADNYRTGLLAGRVLGRWAKQHWGGRAEQVLLLEAAAAGPLPQLRLSGARDGIRETLPHVPDTAFVKLEAKWDFLRAFEATRKYLRRVPSRTTLITGINDSVVLGALHAFEEAGRSQDCAAVCLGAIPEARSELRRKGTRLIGAVAFFPERYGEDIIRTALDILHKRDVPPAVYARFELVTTTNLGKLYPTDSPEELYKTGSYR